MAYDTTWPVALRNYLHTEYGRPETTVPLQGLSHNNIWRVTYPSTSLIVKATNQPREAHFYQRVAPAVPRLSDAVPVLEWLHPDAEKYWLVLEDIPEPLPRSRWLADPEALAVLYELHRCALPPPSFSLFRPSWTDVTTNQALTHFAPSARKDLYPRLTGLQRQSQVLFQPQCWISGDPNPLNWGLRAHGGVVLYDWERLGWATPAIDLAITVPGFGDWQAFELVAETYLSVRGSRNMNVDRINDFAREIALAKVWNVIEFLSMAAIGQVGRTDGVPLLVQSLPDWLENMGRVL